MSRKLTDSKKWRNEWFRTLPPKAKLTWLYLCDECDHAGIWQVDFGLASYQLDFKITPEDLVGWFGDKVHFFAKSYVLIVPYYGFQYGAFKKQWVAKTSAENRLKSLGFEIIDDEVCIPRATPVAQGSDEVTYININIKDNINSLKEGVGENFKPDLENLYAQFPRKQGKAEGLKKLKTIIKTQEDFDNFQKALTRFNAQMAKEKRKTEHIPYFATFVNGQWKDYLDDNVGDSKDFSGESTDSPRGLATEFVDSMIKIFHAPGNAYEMAGADNYRLWRQQIGVMKADFAHPNNNPKFKRGEWIDKMEKYFQSQHGVSA